jgi:hypothetical protein
VQLSGHTQSLLVSVSYGVGEKGRAQSVFFKFNFLLVDQHSQAANKYKLYLSFSKNVY